MALIVVAGGWYLLRGTPASAPAAPAEETQTVASTTTPAAGATITYGPQGFSPASLTVPAGTTVTFVDQGASRMWVASDPHPTHQAYDGTTKDQHCAAGYSGPVPFDQCSAGASYTFTFTKAGTWGYHNHGNAADKGTVVVTAN